MIYRRILTLFITFFSFSNCFCQIEADGFTIACDFSEENSNTSFLGPDFSKLRTVANSSTFEVTYSNFPDDAKLAFQAAINVWQKVLVSRVPIRVSASWEPINGTTLATSGAKKVYRDFSTSALSKVFYPTALAEAIAGKNLNNNDADIQITINKSVAWSYNTDGSRQAFKYDLMTVVLHEIAHGLGFTTSMKLTGTNDSQAQWGLESFPLIYDIYTQNSFGQRLTNNAIISNPSTDLKSMVTSSSIFFKIDKGFYSKDLPKLYAPSVYKTGGSISHLDETKYPKGNENSMMSPQIAQAEVNHFPGTVILAILNQMGWGVIDFEGSIVTAIEPPQNFKKFFIYPNPTTDFIHLIVPSQYQEVSFNTEIYNQSGKLISSQFVEKQDLVKIPILNLSSGAYILKIGNYQSFHFLKY